VNAIPIPIRQRPLRIGPTMRRGRRPMYLDITIQVTFPMKPQHRRIIVAWKGFATPPKAKKKVAKIEMKRTPDPAWNIPTATERNVRRY
jgi:hypothetical protein